MANYKIGRDGRPMRILEVNEVIDSAQGMLNEQKEIQKANERSANQALQDREVHEKMRLLTLQRLRKDAAQPLIAEIVELQADTPPRAILVFNSRRVAPSSSNQVGLLYGHFYQNCEPDEADISIMPDQLNGLRRPRPLKRFDQIQVGMYVQLLWALDFGPAGWANPDNWIAIVDSTLSQKDMVPGNSKNSEATPSAKAVVTSVRGNNDGTVLCTIELDSGKTERIMLLVKDAPQKATRGVVSYGDDNTATFVPDSTDG